jgi:dienelactone hydrolase
MRFYKKSCVQDTSLTTRRLTQILFNKSAKNQRQLRENVFVNRVIICFDPPTAKMMKNILTLILILSFSTIVFGQDCPVISWDSLIYFGPFEVATLEEDDGLRNGSEYDGATIYYPVNAPAGLPAIAIVPGFLAGPSSVADWGPFYASHGIVTMIIGTNSLSDNPAERALGLTDALETLRQENNRPLSPLVEKIDTSRLAVSGWSMGGGGAQLAAVLDNSIKAVIALCPWLPDPELDHDVPVLIFGGQLDAVAPPNSHANQHYQATPAGTDKLRYIVRNGGHQVANDPNGGDRDVGRMALSWLRYYLLDDPCYCPLLLEEPESAFSYETNITCVNVTATSAVMPQADIRVYPNPALTSITVELGTFEPVTYELFSILGESVGRGIINAPTQIIDITALAPNLYFLKIGQQIIKVQVIN